MAQPRTARASVVPAQLRAYATRPRLADLAADRRGAPVLVLAFLLVASLIAILPSGATLASDAAIGGTAGSGSAYNPRTGGFADEPLWTDLSGTDGLGPQRPDDGPFAGVRTRGQRGSVPVTSGTQPGADPSVGLFSEDGTLIKPFAVDTTVPSVADRIRTYRVRAGDSLTGIADHFGISMMTIWWANKLSAKDALTIGQELVIPPGDGLLYTVKEGDTLDAVARHHKVAPQAIVEFNGLDGNVLVIGQELLLPGGKGAPIPAPAPPASVASAPAREARTAAPPPRAAPGTSRAVASTRTASGSGRSNGMAWPVPGGHINQYFHYGHYGVDVGAPYGTPVVAAGGGRVIYAGWRNNGGGYQVWIYHGGNVFTTYNHMSAVSVPNGAIVGRGQLVGRIGATGYATGPHLHFEVWIGPIWSGGYRVNPLNYV